MMAYMKSHGVNVNIATCGQFMAAAVHDHGGTPPADAPMAAAWHHWGDAGYSNDPNAINVAVWNRAMNTSGSHVTGVSPVFDKNGKQTGWTFTGANQGEGRAIVSSHFEGLGVVGPASSQFEIRHMILKPKDGDTQTATASSTPSAPDQGIKQWPENVKTESNEDTVKRVQNMAKGGKVDLPDQPHPADKPAAHDEPKTEAPKEAAGPPVELHKEAAGPPIPDKKAQFGGLFRQATRVLLGEAGPEMVLPLGRPLRDIDTAVLDHLGLRNFGGAAQIMINHKNAPPGVSISTAGDLFKNVSMLRQMAFR
jgi:hypothetical protein